MTAPIDWPLGATLADRGACRVLVWAPRARHVDIILDAGRRERLAPQDRGYHAAEITGLGPGGRYAFSLDGAGPLPDPASRWQPDGPHGCSAVAPGGAGPGTGWAGPSLDRYVIYEMHVGTFTTQGTFAAAAARLPALGDLGITAVEVMPIAQFPGGRNWGYDGVGLFAAQNTYGGPAGFASFVDGAHRAGLAVVLDVVYNHLGPEGNYLPRFGPYFTERHRTPWGPGLNFDQPGSAEVRRFFIENALYWTRDVGVDALRLDAVHAIRDDSPTHIVAEIADAVHAAGSRDGRRAFIIAESSDNDAGLTTPRARGGLGADAQWNDDFHHALRTLLTGEDSGYYRGYGTLAHLEKALTRGFVYAGEFSPARGRPHGTPGANIPARRLVVFSQNHDHAGNRPMGERLNTLITPAQARLAAGTTILSPFIPLLFMGEEYGETAPFQYFVSHTDPGLIEAVRRGRASEFADFFAASGPTPDPQAEETLARSRLDTRVQARPEHAARLSYYRELLRLRREVPALARVTTEGLSVVRDDAAHTLVVRRAPGARSEEGDVLIGLNFGGDAAITLPPGPWRVALCSEARRWGGGADDPGVGVGGRVALPAWSCTLFSRGG